MFMIEPNREPEPRRTGPIADPGAAFAPHRKVRKAMKAMTLEQALAEAAEAGFRQTPRSGMAAAHVQRRWNEAATIKPVPGGVVIAPAWTTGQIVAVLAVLALVFFFTVGAPFAAVIVG